MCSKKEASLIKTAAAASLVCLQSAGSLQQQGAGATAAFRSRWYKKEGEKKKKEIDGHNSKMNNWQMYPRLLWSRVVYHWPMCSSSFPCSMKHGKLHYSLAWLECTVWSSSQRDYVLLQTHTHHRHYWESCLHLRLGVMGQLKKEITVIYLYERDKIRRMVVCDAKRSNWVVLGGIFFILIWTRKMTLRHTAELPF